MYSAQLSLESTCSYKLIGIYMEGLILGIILDTRLLLLYAVYGW